MYTCARCQRHRFGFNSRSLGRHSAGNHLGVQVGALLSQAGAAQRLRSCRWVWRVARQGKIKEALAKYQQALKYAPNWKQLKEARETLTKQKL